MSTSNSGRTRPNVVFILTDDQRHDAIGALGNPYVHTPAIDSLVARGTACTSAFIPGGTCPAVCMPSRAMIHTGRRLFSFPDDGASISAGHALLGETFKGAGYDTYGTGKWHNGPEAFARSFTAGDEIFFGGMWDHWNVPAYSFQASGRYDSAVPYVTDAFHSNEVTWQLSDHVTPGRHSTDLFADAAVSWLDQRTSNDPFFLYVAFMAPHDPRTMPRRYLDQYNGDALPLDPAFMTEYPFDMGVSEIRDERLAAYPREESEARRHLAEYYAMVTHLDDAISRIIAQVAALGQLDNTIFVVAGDNGLALSGHALYGKQSCFDHSVRVPLVFAGPGVGEGRRAENPCYLLDIMPTLCDLCEIETPTTVEGQSLAPSLAPGSSPDSSPREWRADQSVYLAYGDLARAVRTRTHKLIEYRVGATRRTLLFDLVADPAELNDLSDDDSLAGTRAELVDLLHTLRDEWSDASHPAGKRFWSEIGAS